MLSRTPPPPLQLLHDNTIPEHERRPFPRPYPRPPPPRAQWPFIRLFRKLYRSDWRTAVIAVAVINVLRYIFSATNAFEHITPAALRYVPRLTRISATLGWIYMISASIQLFGVASAYLKRLTLIRFYTYLSFLSGLLITAAGLVSGLSYFLLEDELITQCVALSLVGSHHTQGLFHGKSRRSTIPSFKTAYHQCTKAYTHPPTPAALLPLSILLFSFLPSALFFLLSYTYYKQTIDPSHPACLSKPPLILAYTATTNTNPTTTTSSSSSSSPPRTGTTTSYPPNNNTSAPRGRSLTKSDKAKGKRKGRAPLRDRVAAAPPPRQRIQTNNTRPLPDALPLEQLGLLGHTSSTSRTWGTALNCKSVDITAAQPRVNINISNNGLVLGASSSTSASPYNITPGPPSFGTAAAAGAGVAGPSRATTGGRRGVGGQQQQQQHHASRSVWFSKGNGSGGSPDGYGAGYLEYYGGRLL